MKKVTKAIKSVKSLLEKLVEQSVNNKNELAESSQDLLKLLSPAQQFHAKLLAKKLRKKIRVQTKRNQEFKEQLEKAADMRDDPSYSKMVLQESRKLRLKAVKFMANKGK